MTTTAHSAKPTTPNVAVVEKELNHATWAAGELLAELLLAAQALRWALLSDMEECDIVLAANVFANASRRIEEDALNSGLVEEGYRNEFQIGPALVAANYRFGSLSGLKQFGLDLGAELIADGRLARVKGGAT